MPKAAEPGVRYRISVPEQDTGVHEWIRNQLNLSMSVRMLIKNDIHQNGYSDVTCRVEREIPKVEAEVPPVAPVVSESKPKAIFQTQPVVESQLVEDRNDEKPVAEEEKPSIPFQSVGNPAFSAAAMGLLDD